MVERDENRLEARTNNGMSCDAITEHLFEITGVCLFRCADQNLALGITAAKKMQKFGRRKIYEDEIRDVRNFYSHFFTYIFTNYFIEETQEL